MPEFFYCVLCQNLSVGIMYRALYREAALPIILLLRASAKRFRLRINLLLRITLKRGILSKIMRASALQMRVRLPK